MRWTSRDPLRLPDAGRALGAGLHDLSARLFALPRLLQDRADDDGRDAGRRCPVLDEDGKPVLKPDGTPRTKTEIVRETSDQLRPSSASPTSRRMFSDRGGRRGGQGHRDLRRGRRVRCRWSSGLLLALLFNREMLRPLVPAHDDDPADLRHADRGRLHCSSRSSTRRAARSAGPASPSCPTRSWALVSVILVDVWQWTPFCFLVFLAALQGIPDELLEAARIDGGVRLDDAHAGRSCRCCSRRSSSCCCCGWPRR